MRLSTFYTTWGHLQRQGLWGSAAILEENLNIAHMASVTKVICTYDGRSEKYTIQ